MDTNTNVYEKGNIYRAHLVEVSPHIGRRRPIVSLPKDLTEYRRLGNDKMSEEEKAFVDKNVSSGRITFMPDKEKELQQIETRARNICRKSLLIQDYMMHDVYEKVAEDFNNEREAYFAKRDEIASLWGERIGEFSRGLLDFVTACGVPEEDVVMWHKNLMNQLPSYDEWEQSFTFRMEVREYPGVPGTLPGMDENWCENTKELARTLISQQITNLFDQTAKIMTKIQKHGLITKSVKHLISIANRIVNTRTIQEDEMVEVARLFSALQHLDPDMDIEGFSDELEYCMGKLLILADSYKIVLNLSNMPSSEDKNHLILEALKADGIEPNGITADEG